MVYRRFAKRTPWWMKKKTVRKNRFRKRRAASAGTGGIVIRRKVNQISIRGSGIAGSYTVNANNSITLGSGTAVSGLTNVYDVPFTIIARLDELDGVSDLTSMFDRYKIKNVNCKLQACFTANTTTVTPLPYVDWCRDHDDAALPSLSNMRQKMGVKTRYISANKPAVSMSFSPRVATAIFATGISTAYAPGRRPMFIDAAYTNVEHYAIKGVLRNVYLPATAGISPFQLDITYTVALKDVQ